MKKTFGLIFISSLLFVSCKNEPEKNVDTKQNAYKEAYSAVEKRWNDFYSKLNSNKHFKNFKIGTIDLDSVSPHEAQTILMDLRAEERPLKLKFKSEEAFVVYDDLLAILKEEDNSPEKLLNMAISPSSNYSNFTTNSSPFKNMLLRRENGNWDFIENDSITTQEKNEIKNDLLTKVNALDKVKYLILIDDIIIKKSELVNDSEFYTGTIIMQIKCIDMATQKIFARKVFTIENSEKISVHQGAKEDYIDNSMAMDLMVKKVEILNTFFNFKS